MTNYWDETGRKLNKKERFNYVNNRIDSAVAGDSEIAGKVTALETTVGDAETSDTLVYDVADIKNYITEILTANSSLTDPRANQGGDGQTEI